KWAWGKLLSEFIVIAQSKIERQALRDLKCVLAEKCDGFVRERAVRIAKSLNKYARKSETVCLDCGKSGPGTAGDESAARLLAEIEQSRKIQVEPRLAANPVKIRANLNRMASSYPSNVVANLVAVLCTVNRRKRVRADESGARNLKRNAWYLRIKRCLSVSEIVIALVHHIVRQDTGDGYSKRGVLGRLDTGSRIIVLPESLILRFVLNPVDVARVVTKP